MVEIGTEVQIQNGESLKRLISPAPPRLDAHTGCQIEDPVCLLVSMATIHCFFHQLAAQGIEILLGKF